jgi:hypothetical protein
MIILKGRCRRCGGNLCLDKPGDDIHCLLCSRPCTESGETLPSPENPEYVSYNISIKTPRSLREVVI